MRFVLGGKSGQRASCSQGRGRLLDSNRTGCRLQSPTQGKRRFYIITPEALKVLYKHHHGDLMNRGIRNQALFEAYVEYCFVPKHTVGEQLLDVRRDKRERAAFAALGDQATDNEEEDDSDEIDPDMDGRYRIEMAEVGGSEGDPGKREA